MLPSAGAKLLERYGMTETGMLLGNPYRGERRPGTVGQPFEGVDVRVTDADGGDAGAGAAVREGVRACLPWPRALAALPTAAARLPACCLPFPTFLASTATYPCVSSSLLAGPGELRVRSPQLFREYWRRPEATAEAFDSLGYFLTGVWLWVGGRAGGWVGG